jgi:hypothetical protein
VPAEGLSLHMMALDPTETRTEREKKTIMDRHRRPKAFGQCRTLTNCAGKRAEYAFNQFFIQQRHLAGMWRGTPAYRYQWAWWALDGGLLTASMNQLLMEGARKLTSRSNSRKQATCCSLPCQCISNLFPPTLKDLSPVCVRRLFASSGAPVPVCCSWSCWLQ